MKNRTLWASFRAAIAGVAQSAAGGRNMRFHWLAGYAALVVASWLDLPPTEILLLILVVAQVLAAEMLNTAVETVTDLATGRFHPLAKKAKDIAAGAVLVTSLAAVGAALYLFLPRLGRLPGLLADRLSRPDATTLLEVAGFVVFSAYWAISLTPGWARRHLDTAGAPHAEPGDAAPADGAVRPKGADALAREGRRRTPLGGGSQ